MNMKFSEIFQTTECERCGGSGRYSWNAMDGDMCYGCSGAGVKYTKAAHAAVTAFHKALKVPGSQVVVGDRIEVIGVTLGGDVYTSKATVIEIESDEVLRYQRRGSTEVVTYHHHGEKIERVGSSQERREILHFLAVQMPDAFKFGTPYRPAQCPGCGDDESDCECTKLVTCQTCAEQDTTNQCPGCNIRQCDDCVRFSPACCEMCYVVPN